MDESTLDEVFAPLIKAARERAVQRRWTATNSYIVDLIAILQPHPNGLHRSVIFEALRQIRESKGLSVPPDEAIQSAMHRHASQSAVFQAQGRREKYDLFRAPEMGTGVWTLRTDQALAWLTAKIKAR